MAPHGGGHQPLGRSSFTAHLRVPNRQQRPPSSHQQPQQQQQTTGIATYETFDTTHQPRLLLTPASRPPSPTVAADNPTTPFITTTFATPDARPPQRPGVGTRLFSRVSVASKRSFRSFSSSFEADDERSEGDDDCSFLGGFGGVMSDIEGAVAPRYLGEDTRPTSGKELAGWYMYAFAAETYVICAIGSFIPILLESLAREQGVLLEDGVTACGDSADRGKGQCVVYILGVEVNTASFAMYTFSVSVLLQAMLVVSISCAADHGNYRKKLLLLFAWVGSLSVMSYIFISARVYLAGALLAVISNTSFGASFVLLNSFLPLLVRNSPEIRFPSLSTPDLGASNLESAALETPPSDVDFGQDDSTMCASTDALLASQQEGERLLAGGPPPLARTRTHQEVTSMELQLSSQISSKGIGIGYIAGLFVQCTAIVILLAMGSTIWSLRVVLFMVGTWWTVFTIPAAMWLRPRPGPPMPSHLKNAGWFTYITYSWKSLFRTVQQARRLVDIIFFLAAWFLLSDAIATTSSTAILFAKTQLHMRPSALGMINVISTLSGVCGAFGWAYISRFFGLRANQTILVCIALFEIIPLYGLVGYLPFVKEWGVLGLQKPWEMYPLAAVYGFVLGGLSSYCRSLYGELIPPGSEAAFYALYAITDKGSSVFGPAIVGAIIDASGEIRPAFWFLAAVVGVPFPLMWSVDVDRGKKEGEKLAEVIEGFRISRPSEPQPRETESEDGDILTPGPRLLAVYDDTTDTAAPNGTST